MASTEDHIKNVIRFLDPVFDAFNPAKALSEAKDALSHYQEEKRTKKLNQVE